MNEIKIFDNPEFGKVRTMEINGEPYFVGREVAMILGYKNPLDALAKHVEEEDKGVANCDTLGGTQKNDRHQRKRTLQPYPFEQASKSKGV